MKENFKCKKILMQSISRQVEENFESVQKKYKPQE